MEKYKELKEKCDDCLKEMGEPEKIFREIAEKLEQACQLGELTIPENVEYALPKMRLREKAHYCMAEYCKNHLEDVCRWKGKDSESEYWHKETDTYLLRMEMGLQNIWRRFHDLEIICTNLIEMNKDVKDMLMSFLERIKDVYPQLKIAAAKWCEANSYWLEVYDDDHAVRKSDNPDLIIWRGQHIDYRQKCAEEDIFNHNIWTAKAIPDYKEKYLPAYVWEMKEIIKSIICHYYRGSDGELYQY